jgi:hypothetical protein
MTVRLIAGYELSHSCGFIILAIARRLTYAFGRLCQREESYDFAQLASLGLRENCLNSTGYGYILAYDSRLTEVFIDLTRWRPPPIV